VVDYHGKKDLVLLGIIETATETELPYDQVKQFDVVTSVVKKYDGLDYNKIQSLNHPNSEGFVVKFSNGHRCKIKFDDYVKLHWIMTNTSTVSVWKKLRDGESLKEYMQDIPNDYRDVIVEFANSLIDEFMTVEQKVRCIYRDIYTHDRKKFAELALLTPKYSFILFKMYDKQPYAESLWRMVRPVSRKLLHDKCEG
jgi:RNA ligase